MEEGNKNNIKLQHWRRLNPLQRSFREDGETAVGWRVPEGS